MIWIKDGAALAKCKVEREQREIELVPVWTEAVLPAVKRGRPRNFVTWATLASLGLAGCVPVAPDWCRISASVDGMVASRAAMWRSRAPAPIARNIEVTLATGGEDVATFLTTSWAWEVTNDNLRQALERSLDIAELRAAAEPASYRLEASLVGLDGAMTGFGVTLTSTIDYKVSPISQGRTFQTVVVASNYAYGDCGSLRLASESAIRENIRSFVEQLVEFYGR